MSLESNIRNWVLIDNKIKHLAEEMKKMKDEKVNLENDITQHIEENNLTTATIQISDGKLKYAQNKITQNITLKYVDKCLRDLINDTEQVDTIMQYIKSNREETYATSLKRYYKN